MNRQSWNIFTPSRQPALVRTIRPYAAVAACVMAKLHLTGVQRRGDGGGSTGSGG